MDTKIIKSPSRGTIELLDKRRTQQRPHGESERYDAIGLIQGKLIEMVVAADIAEKAANVFVEEIRGLCPQHFSLLAIFGDTASVEAAIDAVEKNLYKDKLGRI
jgi:ethanolamine utilization microcompartment shell protein EutL